MEPNAVQQRRDGKSGTKESHKNSLTAASTSLSRTASECGSVGESCKSSPSLIGSPSAGTAFTPLSNLNPSVSFLVIHFYLKDEY